MYDKRDHAKVNEVKIRLDDKTYELLQEEARKRRMQRAPCARELVEQGLDELLKAESDHNEVSYSLTGVA